MCHAIHIQTASLMGRMLIRWKTLPHIKHRKGFDFFDVFGDFNFKILPDNQLLEI